MSFFGTAILLLFGKKEKVFNIKKHCLDGQAWRRQYYAMGRHSTCCETGSLKKDPFWDQNISLPKNFG